ncbi:hypothetical protein FHS41_008242 [Streptomyces violarus]|uniref:Uncharacterized protein n=1 Tax=Streptomyces violarus TaxID=67380 RepID=A0A7W4ZZP2_9ACTN|nr:hypothetical protein [Streptomyces violarus]MBB3081684.1 hypothetical protein [Streptomyces violarus]
MTDDFASTMVTVIPIVLIVGTAELQALMRMPELSDPSHIATPVRRAWLSVKVILKLILSLGWAALIFLHARVEVRLIFWLAAKDRKNDPALARDVVLTSVAGFLFVVSITTLLVAGRSLATGLLLISASREQAEPEAAADSPLRQTRLFYPAHRATRRPHRPPRRAGTTRAR